MTPLTLLRSVLGAFVFGASIGLAAADTPPPASQDGAIDRIDASLKRIDALVRDKRLNQFTTMLSLHRWADTKVEIVEDLKAQPDDVDLLALLGLAHYGLKEDDQAWESLRRAHIVTPDRLIDPEKKIAHFVASSLTDLAYNARVRQGDFIRSANLATCSIRLEDTIDGRLARANAYILLGRFADAASDVQAAQHFAKGANTENQIDATRVTLLLHSGKTDDAIALANTVVTRAPKDLYVPTALRTWGKAEIKRAKENGDTAGTVEKLAAVAAGVAPDAVELYTDAAKVVGQSASPDWAEMKGFAEKALAVSPENGGANFQMAFAREKLGDDATVLLPYYQKAYADSGYDVATHTASGEAIQRLSPH